MKYILITGCTGTIGSELLTFLKNKYIEYSFILPVRNALKARKISQDPKFLFVSYEELESKIISDCRSLDYVIHLAAPTSSSYFYNNPVETIEEIYHLTQLLLSVSKKIVPKKFVYISSMEIYGEIRNGKTHLKEKDIGYIPLDESRSSYPECKRLCELLCQAYFLEYNVPIVIARPTLTIAKNFAENDNRLIPYSLRLIREGKNIVLNTDGESCRDYIGIEDLCSAIYIILERGEAGGVYNISNEKTFCSINEMLRCLIDSQVKIGFKRVCIEHRINEKTRYFPTKHSIKLDTANLLSLGWTAKRDLPLIFESINI